MGIPTQNNKLIKAKQENIQLATEINRQTLPVSEGRIHDNAVVYFVFTAILNSDWNIAQGYVYYRLSTNRTSEALSYGQNQSGKVGTPINVPTETKTTEKYTQE
jgi:hypothetical protein